MSDITVEIVDEVIVLTLDAAQGPAGAPPALDTTDITYDGSDRCTGYKLNGVQHVVTYPDAEHIVDTGGGVVKTTTLDGLGRIISSVIS